MEDFIGEYNRIRSGEVGFHHHQRGLFEISGDEAVQFLNGLITNDVSKLEDGEQVLAAFPTLKGRIFAVVRVLRRGDAFLFETEEATRQKVYDNLFRFTFAGDFHLRDLSEDYEFFSCFGEVDREPLPAETVVFQNDYFVPADWVDDFKKSLRDASWISDELYEVLRIENGTPKYGVDMDEEIVVPELNIDGMISYEKGCYIGQEVIARIHFRGKPAKQLRGLVFDEDDAEIETGTELKSLDEKSAGVVTSATFSPKLGKTIALAFVRNAFLETGTELKVGNFTAKVSELPFDFG